MTVKELIGYLEQCTPELPVVVTWDEDTITDVTERKCVTDANESAVILSN